MRFKDFLEEAKHREDISLEKAEELLRANCKDAIKRYDQPIWRGSRKTTEPAYLINGEAGGRSSANTSNHYTVIMDHFLPSKGYPKRGASIICANSINEDYARGYGKVYAIFPFDGVKIGVCNEEDIWHLKTEIGGSRREKTIEYWNNWFDNNGIPDYSFEDLVQGIKDTLDDPDDQHYNIVSDVFHRGTAAVEEQLEDAFDPRSIGVQLTDTKGIHHFDDTGRELWIGGKCVGLRLDVWDRMKDTFGVKL